MASPFNIISNGTVPPVSGPDMHPRPDWLRVRFFGGERYQDLKRIMRTLDLHTVCESARCPNMGECWEHRHGDLHDSGDICTRACGFCAVPTGKPRRPAGRRGAEARRGSRRAHGSALRGGDFSVNRDDQPDGGADIFARTITGNSRPRAGLQSGSADSGFSRRLERARNRSGGAARRAESQYGNGSAALSPGAQGRGLTSVRWNCCAAPSKRTRTCRQRRA